MPLVVVWPLSCWCIFTLW